MQLHCAAQGNEGVSDPRRRLSRDQSEIPSNTGRRNSPACSGTDHFHRAAGSSGTHRYLKAQTGTRDDTGFWDQSCRQGHYRTVHPPTQLFPVRSTSKPSLQVHLYVLSMFSHTPFWQMSGSRAHSLISAKTINRWTYLQEKTPTNSKKTLLNMRSTTWFQGCQWFGLMYYITSSITGRSDASGAQSQELGYKHTHHNLLEKSSNNSNRSNITFAKSHLIPCHYPFTRFLI